MVIIIEHGMTLSKALIERTEGTLRRWIGYRNRPGWHPSPRCSDCDFLVFRNLKRLNEPPRIT